MDTTDDDRAKIHDAEERLLTELREHRRGLREVHLANVPKLKLTPGQRVADLVASVMGSWSFIIIQSILLAIWVSLNVTSYFFHWDEYPFILLNLALSFQAAYAAPIIMMSQNRQQDIDRRSAEDDHVINVKAELEIELLHQKIDVLREKEVVYLTETVKELTRLLSELKPATPAP